MSWPGWSSLLFRAYLTSSCRVSFRKSHKTTRGFSAGWKTLCQFVNYIIPQVTMRLCEFGKEVLKQGLVWYPSQFRVVHSLFEGTCPYDIITGASLFGANNYFSSTNVRLQKPSGVDCGACAFLSFPPSGFSPVFRPPRFFTP